MTTSTTKALSITYVIHKIERAPNARCAIAAYDAAVGGSDLSVHRKAGTEWGVWQGESQIFSGSFAQVRTYLAASDEEILDREAADEIALVPAPVMVQQQAQQQQACAARAMRTAVLPANWAVNDGAVSYFGNQSAKVSEVRHDGRIVVAECTSKKRPGWVVLIDLGLLKGKPAPNGFEPSRARDVRDGAVLIRADEDLEAVLGKIEAYALGKPYSLKAAATRSKNAAKGISQSGLVGTPKQRQWAAEIRGAMQDAAGADEGFAALVTAADRAEFWIENRSRAWSDLTVRFDRLKAASESAAGEATDILIMNSTLTTAQSRRCDELVAIQDNLGTFLRR